MYINYNFPNTGANGDGYTCPVCGGWIYYNVPHSCPGYSYQYIPFYPQTFYKYKCPKCKGEFEYWDEKAPTYGDKGYKRCPFCHTEVGDDFLK